MLKVYESADHGMRREYRPDEKRVDFNEAAMLKRPKPMAAMLIDSILR